MNTAKINYSIFTDGSVNQKTKTGIGCYLILRTEEISELNQDEIKGKINHSYFTDTSSTKLEIQILLTALECISNQHLSNKLCLNIYTDSQNIITLPTRREKLMQRNFRTGNGERELKNAELYKHFFDYLDRFNCPFIQVEGHKRTYEKSVIDLIFTLVDRESRRLSRGL
jgi:ribonuclease HI